MSAPISSNTAPQYTWGQICTGWHLLKTDNLSIIEELMPPATSEARHQHAKSHQFFYVLCGELTLELDGATHTLRAGEGIEIPPNHPHQAFNRSQSDTRILVTSHPPSHGDRVPA